MEVVTIHDKSIEGNFDGWSMPCTEIQIHNSGVIEWRNLDEGHKDPNQ